MLSKICTWLPPQYLVSTPMSHLKGGLAWLHHGQELLPTDMSWAALLRLQCVCYLNRSCVFVYLLPSSPIDCKNQNSRDLPRLAFAVSLEPRTCLRGMSAIRLYLGIPDHLISVRSCHPCRKAAACGISWERSPRGPAPLLKRQAKTKVRPRSNLLSYSVMSSPRRPRSARLCSGQRDLG